MKKLRIFSFIVLIVALLVTIDLGFNYLQALTANISGTGDGISIYGFAARIFLGDRLWSFQKYLSIFQVSAWVTFAVLVENTVLSILNLKRQK